MDRSLFSAAAMFCALWMLLPQPTLGALTTLPDRDNLLPVLQKAVGKDWSVAVSPGGYVLTSVKIFSLLPDVSSSSKANLNQRMNSARRTHLVIKILFTAPDIQHQFVSIHAGGNVLPIVEAEKAQNYFSCFMSGDPDYFAISPVRDGPQYAVFLFANISPYESIHPEEQSDEYEAVVNKLCGVFGFNPLDMEIED